MQLQLFTRILCRSRIQLITSKYSKIYPALSSLLGLVCNTLGYILFGIIYLTIFSMLPWKHHIFLILIFHTYCKDFMLVGAPFLELRDFSLMIMNYPNSVCKALQILISKTLLAYIYFSFITLYTDWFFECHRPVMFRSLIFLLCIWHMAYCINFNATGWRQPYRFFISEHCINEFINQLCSISVQFFKLGTVILGLAFFDVQSLMFLVWCAVYLKNDSKTV